MINTQSKNMKYQIFSYEQDGSVGTGICLGGKSYSVFHGLESIGEKLPKTIDELLEIWVDAHLVLSNLASQILLNPNSFVLIDLDKVTINPPVSKPGAIYGAGANYRDHVEAMSRATGAKLVMNPKEEGMDPWHFLKAGRSTLSGHRGRVVMPLHTQKLDWEAELAVVIGLRASKVTIDSALNYVAGYCCSNDLSARDSMIRFVADPGSPFRFDWIGHKSFNGSCPIGPFLTPASFIESPECLDIKLWLNGKLRQNSNTSNHLYSVAEQISFLSHRVDLYPGDIILTGTPAGVGAEVGEFLKAGDVMKVWIDGLGELETYIV